MEPGPQFEGHPYARQIGMVPTEVVYHYREYDRRVPHALLEDIRANGIREPLIMRYSKTTGEASLAEGNHRLAAARQLGISELPVRVYRQHGPIVGNHASSRPAQPAPVGPQEGYVPGDLHPRALGLPAR